MPFPLLYQFCGRLYFTTLSTEIFNVQIVESVTKDFVDKAGVQTHNLCVSLNLHKKGEILMQLGLEAFFVRRNKSFFLYFSLFIYVRRQGEGG